MKKYIGCKMVEAEPCVKVNGKLYNCLPDMDPTKGAIIEYGYKVRYEDGYESFSPKAVFEKAYMEIDSDLVITDEMIDKCIAEVKVINLNGTEDHVLKGHPCVKEQDYALDVIFANGDGILIAYKKNEYEEAMKMLRRNVESFLGHLITAAVNGLNPVNRVEIEAVKPVEIDQFRP